MTVQFQPGGTSPYTWATANASVEIEEAQPNVAVDVRSAGLAPAGPERVPTVRYNETLVVGGRVGADGVGAANVSYLVFIDGEFVAQGETGPNGTLRTDVSLPATVSEGERDVRVSLLTQELALAPANDTATVRVASTPTNLSVTASQAEGGQRVLRVEGRLSVPDGGGVSGQDLSVIVNGTTVGTVTTGRGGQFSSTIVVPEEISGGLLDRRTALDVQVVYDEQRTNLEGTQAQTVTTIRQGLPIVWLLGIVGVLVVGGVGYLLVRGLRRRRGTETRDDFGGFGEDGQIPRVGGTGDTDGSLLARARELLDSGDTRVAIQYGYGAMRARVEREYGLDSAQTPWEFYRACRERGLDEETTETIAELTKRYERAVFASESVSLDDIRSSLDRVEGITDQRGSIATSD